MSWTKLELTWPGKNRSFELEPRILIEKPELSYWDPNTENMLIHWDNLLALKALEQKFSGKIKCIYIDPPFNTGSAFDYYNDNLEHSIWLNLMKNRFVLLKELLSEDWIIWVNLDDCESAYCKVLLDEVFWRNNYLNEIIVSTNKSFWFKSTSNGIFKQANHIFVYCKNKDIFAFNEEEMYVEKWYDDQYKWIFLNTDQPEEKWEWKNIKDIIAEENGYESYKDAKKNKFDVDSLVPNYAIQNADRVFRTASVSWGALQKRKETIDLSKQNKDRIIRHPNDDMDYMFIKGERVIYYKERLKNIDGKLVPWELITDIWNDISVEGLASEWNIDFPKWKKPEKLIYRILKMSSNEGDYVLDSFLWSWTTCAVAQKMGRKWIWIELWDHAYTHSKVRLDNVINGDQTWISKLINRQWWGWYRFYELWPSVLRQDKFWNYIINPNINSFELVQAICKIENFTYKAYEDNIKHGYSTEKDFIHVTTRHITQEIIKDIQETSLKNWETMLIVAKTFESNLDLSDNIQIKKIPTEILDKCEYNKDNYSLPISEEDIKDED